MPKRKNYAAIKTINKRKANNKAAIAEDAGEADLPEGSDASMEQDDAVAGSSNANATDASVEPTVGGGSSGGGASSAGAGIRGQAILPKGLPLLAATYTRVFNKQWKLRIFNRFHGRLTNDTENAFYNVFVPSYDELPVGHLGFYLYPEEFRRLQQATRVVVKDVQAQLFSNTAIITFETNASTTSIGNNNIGVKVVTINPLISKYRSGRFNNDQRNVVANILHGVNPSTLPAATTVSTSFTGVSAETIIRNYVNPFQYFTVRIAKTVPPLNNTHVVNQGFFPVDRFVEKTFNASIEEGVFHSWQFTPTSGLIVSNNAFMEGTAIPGSSSVMNSNSRNMMSQNTNTTATNPTNKRGMPGSAITSNTSELQSILQQNFRNFNSIYDVCVDPFSTGGVGFERIPACIFGFQPMTSVTSSDSVPTPTNIHMDIQVDAWITLEITEGGFMVDNSRVARIVEHNAYEAPQQLQEWTNSGTFASEDHHSQVTFANAQKHILGASQLPLNANPAMDATFKIGNEYEAHKKHLKNEREEKDASIKELEKKIRSANTAQRLSEYTMKYLDLTSSHKRHTRSAVKTVTSEIINNLQTPRQSISDDDAFL